MGKVSLRVAIYPDSRHRYGIGNAIRCAEVARLLCRNHEVFAVVEDDIRKRLFRKAGARLMDKDAFENSFFDVLLFDVQGPFDASELFSRWRNRSPVGKIIAMDYMYKTVGQADIAINLQALWKPGSRGEKVRQDFGLKYAIIRQEFRSCRKAARFRPRNNSILVTFGSEDPCGYSLAVLEEFLRTVPGNIPVTILIGRLNRDRNKIIRFARKHRSISVAEPTFQMARLMLRHDIAICGGGTTLLELAYIGVPALALPQHRMERNFIREFITAGFVPRGLNSVKKVVEYAARLLKNEKEIAARTRIGQELVDGLGPERIVAVIENAGAESARRRIHGDRWDF